MAADGSAMQRRERGRGAAAATASAWHLGRSGVRPQFTLTTVLALALCISTIVFLAVSHELQRRRARGMRMGAVRLQNPRNIMDAMALDDPYGYNAYADQAESLMQYYGLADERSGTHYFDDDDAGTDDDDPGETEQGGVTGWWKGLWSAQRHSGKKKRTPPSQPVDSCRRCEAFSASDFLPAAPDLHLKKLDGEGVLAAQSNSSVPGADLRRQKCRDQNGFLDTIRYDYKLQRYHSRLTDYVRSPEYRARAAAIAAAPSRGVVINAGGSRLLTNLIVTLRVLRHHLNCTLPIEVAWQGGDEMDAATWASLERHFAPIRGVDVQAVPHPVPGLHGDTIEARSYTGKVYSLVISNFSQVLLLDADSLPLMEPSALFEDPRFVQYGSLFWPDAWTNYAKADAYTTYGVDYAKAKAVLQLGKGPGHRDAESGQLLIDRARHLDMLEALLFINRYPEANRGMVWYDKDTFAIAFALVGKAHCYNQVAVPPSGFFHWTTDKLLDKATDTAGPGWRLGGFLQVVEEEPYVYGVTLDANGSTAPAFPSRPVSMGLSMRDVFDMDDDDDDDDVEREDADEGDGEVGAMGAESADAFGAVSDVEAEEEEELGLELAAAEQDGNGEGGDGDMRRRRRRLLAVAAVVDGASPAARVGAGTAGRSGAAADDFPTAGAAQRRQRRRALLAAADAASSGGATGAAAAGGRQGVAPRGRPARPGDDLLAPLGPGLVRPAFLHRTMDKLRIDQRPHLPEVLSAPMTQSWTEYYLAHENRGPTRGVPWDYVVPDTALRVLTTSPVLQWNATHASTLLAKAQEEWRSIAGRRGGSTLVPGDLLWGWEEEEAPAKGSGWWGLFGGGSSKSKPAQDAAAAAAEAARDAAIDAVRDAVGLCPLRDTQDGSNGGCSVAELEVYRQAIDSGVPMDRHPRLEQACLRDLVRSARAAEQHAAEVAEAAAALPDANSSSAVLAYREARDAGVLGFLPLPRSAASPVAYLDDDDSQAGLLSALLQRALTPKPKPNSEGERRRMRHAHDDYSGASIRDDALRLEVLDAMEQGDPVPTPLPAVRHDWLRDPWPCSGAPFAAVVRASLKAYGWVRRRRVEFPVLERPDA